MEALEVGLRRSSRDDDLGCTVAAVVGTDGDAEFVDDIVGVAVSAHDISGCDWAAEGKAEVGCVGLDGGYNLVG